MKILLLQEDFPPFAQGGAATAALAMARVFVEQGHDVAVVTSVQEKSAAGFSKENDMQIYRIYSDYHPRWRSWRSLYNPATIPHIRRIFAEIQPDIVHAHNVHYHLSYWALRLARRSGARVFLTAHDMMLFHYGKLATFVDREHPTCQTSWNYRVSAWSQLKEYRFWYNPLRNTVIKWLLQNVDVIFAVSGAVREALKQNGISNTIEVLHNTVSTDEWVVSQEDLHSFTQKHNLEGKKVVLFGGRVSGPKGGTVILEALPQIIQRVPTVVLLVLGRRDAYLERLITQAKALGVAEHICTPGWLSGNELRAANHLATLVVVPSVCFDSCPMVILEAMACKKPVVGSCFGGIPELIVDGVTGYLVHPYDKLTLVERISELLLDKQKQTSFGEAGYARVRAEFNPESWYSQVYTIYKKYERK